MFSDSGGHFTLCSSDCRTYRDGFAPACDEKKRVSVYHWAKSMMTDRPRRLSAHGQVERLCLFLVGDMFYAQPSPVYIPLWFS